MWHERKKLVVLAAIAVVLAIAVLLVYAPSREAPLIRQFRDGTAGEKVEAIHALEQINSDAAAQAIAEGAGNANPRVAGQAISALGRMGRSEYLDRIRKGAGHEDQGVREAAAAAMGDLGGSADVPVLMHSLKDESQGRAVRAAAATSLGKLNDYNAMPALLAALDDPDPLVRGRAYAAIRRIIQLDVGFHAEDPPAKRRKAVARLQTLYPHLRARHERYVQRMKEKKK